jgi:tripartite ATP-independent transporter DctM subunit
MSYEAVMVILLFAGLIVLLFSGLPIVFCLGGLAAIAMLVINGPDALSIISLKSLETMENFILVAIPLFIFMASMLQRSGVTEDMYEAVYRWSGPVRGGLAVGTVLICAVMGAMTAVSAAATISMGLIAIPSMLKRGYDKRLAVGTVAAGGALGQLIPPGTIFICIGIFAGLSIGKLFAGGIFAGLVLVILFDSYILVRCYLQPELGPALPREDRATWKEKMISVKAVIWPVIIIIMVLGSIFGGVTTVTEAAAMGALGSFITTIYYRKLTWQIFQETMYQTAKISAMIIWIIFAGMAYNSICTSVGTTELVKSALLSVSIDIGRWGIILIMELILLFLGCLLEPIGIVMITSPIFFPIIISLGFDPIWFGVLFVMNMEMSYITPPVGFNLFYLKAIVPKEVTLVDIYQSVMPFIFLQATGILLCCVFPEIITWLPNQIK